MLAGWQAGRAGLGWGWTDGRRGEGKPQTSIVVVVAYNI